MTINLLLASTFFLLTLPAPQTPNQPHHPAFSNTFVTAAETLIDDASTIDVASDDADFDPKFQQLTASNQNLKRLAQDQDAKYMQDAHDVLDAANYLVFSICACHIQANNGADTTKCKASIAKARTSAMESIAKHKNAGTWVDGPPM